MRASYCSISLAGAALMAALGIARANDDIRTYTVPKDHPPVTAAATAAAPDVPVNAAPVHWTVPTGWQQLAPTSIRLGNFVVPGQDGKKAEVTVTSFPGTVGTDLDNVNRWRREVGLEPVEQSGVSAEPVRVDGLEGKQFDFTGPSAQTLVASVPRDGAMWFFKMRGDADVVTGAKPAFSDFLKSVRFSGTADASSAPAAVPPPAAPSPAPAALAGAAADSPKWETPAGWTETEPGSMIFKKYSIAGQAGEKAAVSVSFFPGDVGGLFANVNRWRGQMGLPPVQADQLGGVTESVETAGGKATLVDFSGTDARSGQPARLVGAIVPRGDRTWFYKLLGDSAVVGREKDSFVRFVKGVHYP